MAAVSITTQLFNNELDTNYVDKLSVLKAQTVSAVEGAQLAEQLAS